MSEAAPSIGIILDVDGTIIDKTKAKRCARLALLEYMKEEIDSNIVPERDVYEIQKIYQKKREEYPKAEERIEREIRTFAEYCDDRSYILKFSDLENMRRIFFENYLKEENFHDEVEEAFKRLSDGGYSLGVNTACNTVVGNVMRKWELFQRHIGNRMTVAEEIGIWEKNEESLQHTMSLFEEEPDVWIYVGDRYHDFVGTNKMKDVYGVLVDREELFAELTFENAPDFVVGDLTGIESVIQSIKDKFAQALES